MANVVTRNTKTSFISYDASISVAMRLSLLNAFYSDSKRMLTTRSLDSFQ